MSTWRVWAPQKRKQLEGALGIVNRSRQQANEYESTVAGMTEEEEWDYARGRYGPEFAEFNVDEEEVGEDLRTGAR